MKNWEILEVEYKLASLEDYISDEGMEKKNKS